MTRLSVLALLALVLAQGARAETPASRALRMARIQPAVGRVLAAHPAVTTAAPWAACSGRALGYVVDVRFRRPATFTILAPFVVFGPWHYAYREGVREVTAIRSTHMWVYVDLNRGRVVGVDPVPEEGFAIPLRLLVMAHAAGGPDSPCPTGD